MDSDTNDVDTNEEEIIRIGDYGDTLLHFYILEKSEAQFDQVCKPSFNGLNAKNFEGETPLLTACRSETTNYFTLKLIEVGADLRLTDDNYNDTILHLTKDRATIDRVLQIDYDLIDFRNKNGETPLYRACSNIDIDKIHQLLYYNADALMKTDSKRLPLGVAMLFRCDETIIEILLNYTFDNIHTTQDLRLFLFAMQTDSPFVEEMVNKTSSIVVGEDDDIFIVNAFFCHFDKFKLFFEKFSNDLIEQQLEIVVWKTHLNSNNYEDILKKLEFLLDNQFMTNDVDLLLTKFDEAQINMSDLIRIDCFLLSYGFELKMEHLCEIYTNYNYCELFKMLLYMVDFDGTVHGTHLQYVVPYLIINVFESVSEILQKYQLSIDTDPTFSKLLSYTAVIKQFLPHYDGINREIVEKITQLPDVPSLAELARNQVRNSIIQRFNVKTCSQFYTIVNRLSIPDTIRKIITFESPLY